VGKNTERQSLDNMSLLTRKEFLDYSERLSNHLDAISKSEFYPDLVENFLNGITNSMSVEDVKRLATALQVITIRKQGEEREKKSKAKSKKSAKPQLKAVRQSDYGAFGADAVNDFDQDVDYDDEDFM
jgi:proline dehydrogenase